MSTTILKCRRWLGRFSWTSSSGNGIGHERGALVTLRAKPAADDQGYGEGENAPGEVAQNCVERQHAVAEEAAQLDIEHHPEELANDGPEKEAGPGVAGDSAGEVDPGTKGRE